MVLLNTNGSSAIVARIDAARSSISRQCLTNIAIVSASTWAVRLDVQAGMAETERPAPAHAGHRAERRVRRHIGDDLGCGLEKQDQLVDLGWGPRLAGFFAVGNWKSAIGLRSTNLLLLVQRKNGR